jgi:site-specific recombinase XerC
MTKKQLKRDVVRINSGEGSSAQSVKLCAGVSPVATGISVVYDLLRFNNDLTRCDKAVLEIMLISGCRIGSVLFINSNSISPNGLVLVKAEKGGRDIIVSPVLYREFWLSKRLCNWSLSSERNRFYYYRLFKKYGVYSVVCGNFKASVTHLLRHELINDSDSISFDSRTIANYAGHNSLKSQESYVTKKRIKVK